MQEVFEKILERLQEEENILDEVCNDELTKNGITAEYEHAVSNRDTMRNAIEIFKHEAEQYNGGWIPLSDRLPEVNKMVLLYAPYMEYEPISIGCLWQGTDDRIGPYFKLFAHWEDNDTTKGGLHYMQGCPYICPGNVYEKAWMPLPEPYKNNR